MAPQRVYAASQPGAVIAIPFAEGAVEARIERHVLGEVAFPTGEVVACDPLTMSDNPKPFSLPIPPGKYPVTLCVAHFSDDQRVAAAFLQLRNDDPDHWEMAAWSGQDLGKLQDDEIYGYGVDSGTGCFMDLEAARLLVSKMTADEFYWETLLERMNRTYVHTWSWANVELDSRTGLNCSIFSTGFGDGFYASYWGKTADGVIVHLMTDFGILGRGEPGAR